MFKNFINRLFLGFLQKWLERFYCRKTYRNSPTQKLWTLEKLELHLPYNYKGFKCTELWIRYGHLCMEGYLKLRSVTELQSLRIILNLFRADQQSLVQNPGNKIIRKKVLKYLARNFFLEFFISNSNVK